MLRSILKLQRATPISVGLGGPFSGLFHALTGVHKILPFWALCPLWCLFFAPLILLVPIIVPIYAISILQMMYRKRDVYSYLPKEELSDEPLEEENRIAERRFRNIYLENAPSSQLDSVHNLNAEKVLAHGVSAKEEGFSKGEQGQTVIKVEDSKKVYLHNVVGLIQISIKSNLLSHKHMLFFSQLCYWMLIAIICYGIAYFSFLAFQDYSAATHGTSHILQAATPELLDYADRITTIFTTGGMLIWFSMIYFIALTLCIAIGSTNPSLTALKFLGKNFLGLAVVSCFLCSIGITLERSFSHYVIVAYKDIILGREAINPSYLFMVLRALVVYVFTMGLSLCVMMSLRLIPLSFKKDEDNWPKGEEPVESADIKEHDKHKKNESKQGNTDSTVEHNCHTASSQCKNKSPCQVFGHYSFQPHLSCEFFNSKPSLTLGLNNYSSGMCLA